jgi:hypothetical protein
MPFIAVQAPLTYSVYSPSHAAVYQVVMGPYVTPEYYHVQEQNCA